MATCCCPRTAQHRRPLPSKVLVFLMATWCRAGALLLELPGSSGPKSPRTREAYCDAWQALAGLSTFISASRGHSPRRQLIARSRGSRADLGDPSGELALCSALRMSVTGFVGSCSCLGLDVTDNNICTCMLHDHSADVGEGRYPCQDLRHLQPFPLIWGNHDKFGLIIITKTHVAICGFCRL